MEAPRLCLEFCEGLYWRWQFVDASGDVIAQSIMPYFDLVEAIQAIDELRITLTAVKAGARIDGR